MPQTIQQQRAAYALEAIHKARRELRPDALKELKSYASALPAMIHMNGLGQAAAFILSKGQEAAAYQRLYDILGGWLCAKGKPYAGYNDLMGAITGADMHAYRLAQAEAQALLDWVKKFANAYLEDVA